LANARQATARDNQESVLVSISIQRRYSRGSRVRIRLILQPRFSNAQVGRVCWTALLLVALLLPAGSLRSQQNPQIRVEVKVVNVLATVRDKRGQIVSNLGKDDFAIEEDGRPQTITYFTRESDLPLSLGLLVDTSGSQRRVLDDERAASRSFIDNMLREDRDQAFVLHFDREVELLQDLTSSRQKLESALDLLGAPQLVRAGGGSGGGNGAPRQRYSGGGTTLYDAVYLASDEVIKKQQGRKALIVLSDGVDHGSKETLVDAIMTAQHADTMVYAILFADEQFQNPFAGFGGPGMGRHGGGHHYPDEERVDGKKILERISRETGGRLFEVTKKQPIDQIYASIAEELRNQYSLGYTPGPEVSAGYHKIHLTLKQKELTVRARDGYYSN
jgi:VWFA-related protein